MKRFFLFALLAAAALWGMAQDSAGDDVVQKVIQTRYNATMSGASDEFDLFARTYLAVLDLKPEDAFADMQVNGRDLTFQATIKGPSVQKKSKSIFAAKAHFRIVGDMVTVTLDSLMVTQKKLVLMIDSEIDDEGLTNNKKHNALLHEAQATLKQRVSALLQSVSLKQARVKSQHRQAIENGMVEKGMTPDECLLAKGKPQSTYKQDSHSEQWNYGMLHAIFFKDGVVSGSDF